MRCAPELANGGACFLERKCNGAASDEAGLLALGKVGIRGRTLRRPIGILLASSDWLSFRG